VAYTKKIKRLKVRGVRTWEKKRADRTRMINRAAEKRGWKNSI
jgi:hypothetical protein